MRFNLILVDVPWSYRNKNTGGSMKSGASYVYGADNKYSTMSMDELKELPIDKISSKNAVMFFWVTTNMQKEAMDIIDIWGFTYKTKIYWYKKYGGNKMGMGFWYRNAVEELWICVKGNIKAFHYQKPNIMTLNVSKHSEKPEEFRKLIMKSTANIKHRRKLELFGRKLVRGWKVIGYEIDGLDIREALKQLYNVTTI